MPSSIHLLLSTFIVCSLICCEKRENKDSATKDKDDRGIIITSEQEPKNDSDTLAILGIKMTPKPSILFREYNAGLDDSMYVVLELPSNQLQDIIDSIKWSDDLKMIENIKLRTSSHKIWNSHKSSKKGLTGVYTINGSEFVSVYIADDIILGMSRLFIFWHQT